MATIKFLRNILIDKTTGDVTFKDFLPDGTPYTPINANFCNDCCDKITWQILCDKSVTGSSITEFKRLYFYNKEGALLYTKDVDLITGNDYITAGVVSKCEDCNCNKCSDNTSTVKILPYTPTDGNSSINVPSFTTIINPVGCINSSIVVKLFASLTFNISNITRTAQQSNPFALATQTRNIEIWFDNVDNANNFIAGTVNTGDLRNFLINKNLHGGGKILPSAPTTYYNPAFNGISGDISIDMLAGADIVISCELKCDDCVINDTAVLKMPYYRAKLLVFNEFDLISQMNKIHNNTTPVNAPVIQTDLSANRTFMWHNDPAFINSPEERVSVFYKIENLLLNTQDFITMPTKTNYWNVKNMFVALQNAINQNYIAQSRNAQLFVYDHNSALPPTPSFNGGQTSNRWSTFLCIELDLLPNDVLKWEGAVWQHKTGANSININDTNLNNYTEVVPVLAGGYEYNSFVDYYQKINYSLLSINI